jgi:hypothetical protein
LWGEEGENIEEEKLAEIMAQPVNVYLTFNNQEWIEGPTFEYHDYKAIRLKYGHQDMAADESGADSPTWEAEVPEDEPPEDMTEEQLVKYNEERQKQAEADTEEVKTSAKRKGYKLLIVGDNLRRTDAMSARFSW